MEVYMSLIALGATSRAGIKEVCEKADHADEDCEWPGCGLNGGVNRKSEASNQNEPVSWVWGLGLEN